MKWQRGHPEKHKWNDKADCPECTRPRYLRAVVYEADLIADEFSWNHTLSESDRVALFLNIHDLLSHDAQWVLWWRGETGGAAEV